jgi:hypothetical protein
MKNLSFAVLAAAVLFSAGCSTTTSHGPNGSALTLLEPSNQTIERGTTNDIMIAVDRGGFSGPVAIRFDGLPHGVSIVDANPTIQADDNVVMFTMKATRDAAIVSNQYVTVTATGPGELSSTESFKMSVESGN